MRRYFSKSFFNTLNKIASTKKNPFMAIKFKGERRGGNFIEGIGIGEYIENLYQTEHIQIEIQLFPMELKWRVEEPNLLAAI